MTVLDTIDKAERWFEKLSQAYKKADQTEIQDILSTLLVTTRSIPEHLLEDFNQKFGLNIPLDERRFKKEFKKRVNGESREFLTWFDDALEKIKNNPTCSILMNKRNIDTHRKSQNPDHTVLSLSMTETISSHASIMVFPAGTTKEDAMRISREKHDAELKKIEKKKQKQKIETSQSKTDFYFQDLPDTNVLEASKLFLDAMKLIVKLANEKF